MREFFLSPRVSFVQNVNDLQITRIGEVGFVLLSSILSEIQETRGWIGKSGYQFVEELYFPTS